MSDFKTVGVVGLLIVGVVVGMFVLFQLSPVVVQTQVEQMRVRTWNPIPIGDGPFDGENSTFLYFMNYPHQASPGTAYASNLSNSSLGGGAYEFRDLLDGEMTNETPYNTPYDKVVKFVVNDTVGYNVSGSRWEDSWVRANLTCDFDYATDISDESMTIVQIANTSSLAWYHGYLNNAAAGYQITKDEKFNITEVKGEGYW